MRVLVLVGCLGSGAAAQVQVVSPNFRATTEGNSGNLYPFSAPTVARYQQVFGAGSLSSIVGRPITAVAFRLDSQHTTDYTAAYRYATLTIRMSITTRAVDQLSTTLNSNPGPSPVTVYNGPYTVPT